MRKRAMQRIFKATSLFVLLSGALPGMALACPYCYGAVGDSEVVAGIRLAMLALIAVTAVIGCGILMFVSNMKKRSRLYEKSRTAVDSSGEIIQQHSF